MGPQRVNTRIHFDCSSSDLKSTEGAQLIVNALKKKSAVKHLLLGQNALGDEGVEVVMDYLCTEDGRRLPIEEISLNVTGMGDVALDAVSCYLVGNQTVVGLHLPHNHLRGENGSVRRFVEAINSSSLRTLNLTYNSALSDAFLAEFLSKLNSPHLKELKLSCISLSPASGPVITSYLSSEACLPLRVLKLNANRLELDVLKDIKRVMEERNFSLTCLEVFANHIGDSPEKDGIYLAISKATKRNMDLARCTRQEALALLPIARCLLLESSQRPTPPQIPPPAVKLSLHPKARPKPQTSVWSTSEHPTSCLLSFPFHSLPKELQHHILTHLCPTLGPAQKVRIFTYASSLDTLPSLKLGLAFPSLQKVSCISDPTTTMMSGFSCSGDPKTCLGPDKALICGREEKRNWWLQVVGCDRFELAKAYEGST